MDPASITVELNLSYRGFDGHQYIPNYPISMISFALFPKYANYTDQQNGNFSIDSSGFAIPNHGLGIVSSNLLAQNALPGYRYHRDADMPPDGWWHKDYRDRGEHWDSDLFPGVSIDRFLRYVSIVGVVPTNSN